MQRGTSSGQEATCTQSINQNMSYRMQEEKLQPSQLPRCLVIDDNKVVLQFVAKMMSRLGYQVDTAETKADVASKLSSSPYDLIVTDLEMPDMSGYKLTVMIKKKQLASKVIIMTGSYKGDCAEMMDSGWADGWLFKPFGLNDLRAKIEESMHIC
jgi:DNA-binding response OmpR family regulator